MDLDRPEDARFRLLIEIADAHCSCIKTAGSAYGSLYPTTLRTGGDAETTQSATAAETPT